MAKKWKCKTDHEHDTIHLGEFNYTIHFKDTPYVDILDFGAKGKPEGMHLLPNSLKMTKEEFERSKEPTFQDRQRAAR